MKFLSGNKLWKVKSYQVENLSIVETYFGPCRMTDDFVK